MGPLPRKDGPGRCLCTATRGLTGNEVPAVNDPVIRHVPPNSSALRELAYAINDALALPKSATTRDELTYLRITRDRARLVRAAMRRILADREIDDSDVMAMVASLRDQAGQLPDDAYDHNPLLS
jgi:hypothetical protein